MPVNAISMAIEITREQMQAAEQARQLYALQAAVLQLVVKASEGKLTMSQLLEALTALVSLDEEEASAPVVG